MSRNHSHHETHFARHDLAPLSPEQEQAGTMLHRELSELLDHDRLADQRDKLHARILGDSALMKIEHDLDVLEKWSDLRDQFRGDMRLTNKMFEMALKLEGEMRASARYSDYWSSKRDEAKYSNIDSTISPSLRLPHDDLVAKSVLGQLMNIGKMIDTSSDNRPAPFANHDKNNEHSWEYVAPDDTARYLNGKTFIDTSRVAARTDKIRMHIMGSADRDIEVPISLVFYAAGFDSWLGWDGAEKSYGSGYGYTRGSSLEAMMHYAGLESPLPPVGTLYVYVQPDGRVFVDNGSGDSHRIGAAYLRGDLAIKARAVEVIALDTNQLK